MRRLQSPHRAMRGEGEIATSQCRILSEYQLNNVSVALRSTISYSLDDEGKEEIVESDDEWRIGQINDKKIARESWQELPYGLFATHRKGLVPRFSSLREIEYHKRRYYEYYHQKHGRPFSRESKKLLEYARHISDFRSRISYYSASQFTNPGRCPSSIEIEDEKFLVGSRRSRYEHQRFMHDLYQLREANPNKYAAYISLVGRDGLKLISNIHWKKVKVASNEVEVRKGGKIVKLNRQRLLVVPSAQCGDDRLSFSQLSEGTFKSLALIFYLLTDNNKLLLIEEPEVCVHHGLLASIVELIKSQSKDKQIIFSTHADFVLDQVEPDEVFSTVNKPEHGTTIRSLSRDYSRREVNALREFLKTSGNLGEYWRQGGLDH